MVILLVICLVIIIVLLILLLSIVQNNAKVHNKSDIELGMEYERRKREYKEYLSSRYYDTIPPLDEVREGYREIEKEVFGHYLHH